MRNLRNTGRAWSLWTVAWLLCAGTASVEAQSDELELSADLDGSYANGVAITGGTWEVSEPEAGISMVFAATGLVEVNQFEFILSFEPPSAFNIDIARFRGFVSDDLGGVEVQGLAEVHEDGRLRFAGGVLGDVIDGDSELGTLLLLTSDSFDPDEPARIIVDLFSVGPSADDRDSYDETALNMGVIVAAQTAVSATTWGSVKEEAPWSTQLTQR